MSRSITEAHMAGRSRRRVLHGMAGLMLAVSLPAPSTRGADMPEPATVSGTVEFPPNLLPVGTATVYVRVEDVSRMDAPSLLVASQTLRDVPMPPPPGEPVSFAILVPSYDPRLSYSVRVHVDRDGDGQVSVGDLVSTFSHPVLTHGAGSEVIVPVSVV